MCVVVVAAAALNDDGDAVQELPTDHDLDKNCDALHPSIDAAHPMLHTNDNCMIMLRVTSLLDMYVVNATIASCVVVVAPSFFLRHWTSARTQGNGCRFQSKACTEWSDGAVLRGHGTCGALDDLNVPQKRQ